METPGAYPRRKHLKGAPIGLALTLPSNSKTWLERVSKDKRSSLLGLVISDEGKKFYNIDTRTTRTSAQSRTPEASRRWSSCCGRLPTARSRSSSAGSSGTCRRVTWVAAATRFFRGQCYIKLYALFPGLQSLNLPQFYKSLKCVIYNFAK